MQATIHGPGEGRHVGGSTAVTTKGHRLETDGSRHLGEALVAPGFRARIPTSGSTACSMSLRGWARVPFAFLNFKTPRRLGNYMRDSYHMRPESDLSEGLLVRWSGSDRLALRLPGSQERAIAEAMPGAAHCHRTQPTSTNRLAVGNRCPHPPRFPEEGNGIVCATGNH